MKIGPLDIHWGTRTYVMGILNVTPDSFSGDGLLAGQNVLDRNTSASEDNFVERALEQSQAFLAAGVDILDIGGESTRPGAQPVSPEEEERRVLPVVQALAGAAAISVDTSRASVAEAALLAGAHMINDVWGLRADPDLAKVIAAHHVPIILMHNRSSWATPEVKERLGGRYIGAPYQNLLAEVRRELLESVALAHAASIPDQHIILDPGIGFGKTVEQNLELLDRLDEICSLGYPVLLGPSRKSFIGYTLDRPPDQRLEGTAAAVAIGIARGADLVRVHDVTEMGLVVRMADAIVRRKTAA